MHYHKTVTLQDGVDILLISNAQLSFWIVRTFEFSHIKSCKVYFLHVLYEMNHILKHEIIICLLHTIHICIYDVFIHEPVWYFYVDKSNLFYNQFCLNVRIVLSHRTSHSRTSFPTQMFGTSPSSHPQDVFRGSLVKYYFNNLSP